MAARASTSTNPVITTRLLVGLFRQTIVPSPTDSQALNRYSYARNIPLSSTTLQAIPFYQHSSIPLRKDWGQ